MTVTQERVRELLSYDAETGVFTWLRRSENSRLDKTFNARFAGTKAGSANSNGYLLIGIKGRLYPAHRLAWLWFHGTMPADQIDHIDGNRANNAIANLREATNSQNQRNRGSTKLNTSGFKGVSWRKEAGKWYAQIKIGGRPIFLGYYDTPAAASASYSVAAAKYHGSFANAGGAS
jgi:hypothetical protein